MRALFLVAFFSFLRISNLVPYKLSEIDHPRACYLTPSSVTFTAQGVLLRITHTKTIQFRERVLEIPLPRYGALSGSKFNVQTFSSLNFETSLFAYNYFLIAAHFPV